MSKTINDYTAAVSIDATADFLLLYQSAVYKKINRNVFLGLASAPLGTTDSQSPTNKTFDSTNAFTIKDGSLTLQNTASATKQAIFSLASITAGQTRTITVPDASLTMVGTATTQTLTNKTITSPTITGGTIDNSVVTVDTISGHTTPNTMTVAGISISNSVFPQTALPTGVVVQVVNTVTTNASTTGTTTIPYDATIPQNTEGDQYMTLAITPKSATNVLIIDTFNILSTSAAAGNALIAAIFQDSTVNALAAAPQYTIGAGYKQHLRVVHSMTAGTTSSTTFKLRAGANVAGTTTFGDANLGAITRCFMSITEYKA